MSSTRVMLVLLAVVATMAMALMACGSGATPETVVIEALPEPTSSPQPPVIITATPAPTGTPVVVTATPGPSPTPLPPVTVVITATPEPTATAQPRKVLVTGTGSKVVEFDRPPERMIVYDGAAVEMLFAIGEGHRVAGTHSYVTYPPETESISKVGDAFNMDIEAIVALEPDLVYVFYDRFNSDLEGAGLKVLYIETLSHGFTDVSGQIRMWGAITGATEEANTVADEFDARVAVIREKLADIEPAQSIYSHGFGWWAPGRDTLVNDVFELLKLKNIADFEGYQQISPEAVVAANPDIILGDPSAVAAEPVLAGLHGTETHHIFTLSEGNTFSVAGPRFIDAVEEMAAWVYPELFP